MGLLMYLLIYMITVMLILNHKIIPQRIFFSFWFAVMLSLSFSIRWTIIESNEVVGDNDLAAFVLNMKFDDGFISYHLREPVFWYGIQFLYSVIGNAGLVFVTIDIIIFITFYKSVHLFQTFFLKNINFYNVRYLYFGAFLCYPYIAGMHNHYRQILAVTIAFYAIGIANKKFKKSTLIFIISIAIHNAMIILAPIIFLLVGNRKIWLNLLFMASLTIILSIIIPLFFANLGFDAWYEINRRFKAVGMMDASSIRNVMYLIIMIFGACLVIFLELSKKGKTHFLLVSVLVYMTIVYALTVWLLPDQPSSRIFFLILSLIYLLFGLYIEVKFKTEPIVRLLYFHVSLIPLLGLRGDGLVYYFI